MQVHYRTKLSSRALCRAGPVVLAGGAAALGPHMAGAQSCMYGGSEKVSGVLESLHVPSP